jgi:multimeric flavodoxin WrbA
VRGAAEVMRALSESRQERNSEMKVIAFNGSPRKEWNTATLLGKALEGAASKGAETKLIHLYDLHFTGCKSCFACKLKGGHSYGKCATRDDLTPILKEVEDAGAIILGTPVYFASVSGETKCFMERLMFPYLVYDVARSSLFPAKIHTGFIYTMGLSEAAMNERGYMAFVKSNEGFLGRIFGACESLCSFDAYQFDYSKMVADAFDPAKKAARRKDVFPLDCEKAFQMGARFASGAVAA